jgi:hypothetical protein
MLLYLLQHLCCKKMATDVFNNTICVICRGKLIDTSKGKAVKVTGGIKTILEYSEKYCDTELSSFLMSNPSFVMVHYDCRRDFTSKHRHEQASFRERNVDLDESMNVKKLRSVVQAFYWKNQCFFVSNLLCSMTVIPIEMMFLKLKVWE